MYDVFLSHNSQDKAAIETLARRLIAEAGLRPYLDRWHLVPGLPWQPELEKALEESTTAAIFIGPGGLGPWHHEELRAALARAVQQRDDYRVIPVLLPGATREAVRGFLAQRMWVDFSAGLEDAAAFRRLVAGIKGLAPERDEYRLPDEPAPYRGLLAFDEAHARFFFGRQAEAEAVLEKLSQHPFVTVVGPSGVGKSSLVLGGVLPRLRERHRGPGGPLHVWVMRPGTRPLRALADQVATLVSREARLSTADSLTARFAAQADGLRTALDTLSADAAGSQVLVVDQLEELFTLAPEESGAQEVEAFLRNLRDAAERGRGRLRVLATLRADFFGRSLHSPVLRELLQDRQVLLGSMGPEALRDVIVRPAQAVGAYLENGVVSTILRDVAHQPGALPLLEYALDELWRAREGAWLKLSTYEAGGGVSGALEKRAQAALQSLPPRGQEVARRLFLRLTTLGEGAEDTRRRVARSELHFTDASPEEVEEVLQRLSGPEARLLVAEEATVEVAHEVLIRQWPTLRRWLEEDKRRLRIHRRLTEAANEWATHGHDASFLYTGARLLEAEETLPLTSPLLNAREREFLTVSLQARETARRKEEGRRAQDLAQAQSLARESSARAEAEKARAEAEQEKASTTSRANRRLRVLAGGLVLTAILLALFWRQARNAQDISLSRELTANALLRLSDDPQLSLLLIQEAQATAMTEQVPHALMEWARSPSLAVLRGHVGEVRAVSFNADGSRVVTAGQSGPVRVWDAATGKLLATTEREYLFVLAVDFSADSPRMVTSGLDGPQVWDAATGKLLATLSEHEGIIAASFSADGSRIATAGSDMTARVWEAVTGRLLTTLSGHTDSVLTAHFSTDGSRIATASLDKTARVWDVATGRLLATLSGHTDAVRTATFSTNSSRILTTSMDGTARLWDTATGKLLTPLSGHTGSVLAASFSADGSRVVTASMDKTARLWDTATGTPLATLSGHTDAVRVAAFSADDSRLVTASKDGTARVWEAATGKPLTTLSGHTDGVMAASFSTDGSRLVTGSEDATARIWGAATDKPLVTLSGHYRSVLEARFSADGSRVVTASEDKTARLWDAATGKPLATLSGHTDPVWAASFSADGSRVVTASQDTTARLWDAATGKPLATVKAPATYMSTGSVLAVGFSADTPRVLTKNFVIVEVWGTATDKPLAALSREADSAWEASFSADGSRVLTVGSDGMARVWETATGKLLATLSEHTSSKLKARFSADGSRVVTAGVDHTAWVWDAVTGKPLVSFSGHEHIVMTANFSTDGSRLVTTSLDDTARVWDAATGRLLTTLSGHALAVFDASFSADGSRVVTASADGTARVWDADTGKSLAALSGHTDAVWTASFSADGSRVLTVSRDGTARLWHHILWTPSLVAEFHAGRELSCAERKQYLHEDIDCPPDEVAPASTGAVTTGSP